MWTQETRKHGRDDAYEVMLDERGRVLFDTANSDVACIERGFGEDYLDEWDSVGRKNFATIITAMNEKAVLARALEESVKLQSHYAALLNQYDGGARVGFESATAWIDRLAAIDAGKKVYEETGGL